MNDLINSSSITEYLSKLSPTSPLEVAKASHDAKIIMQALITLIDRLNSSRQVKLLQGETDTLRAEVKNISSEIELASSLNDEREDLIKNRKKLLTEKETIDDLWKLKAEIEHLKKFVADHNIPLLQQKVRELQKNIGEDVSDVNKFFVEADSFFKQLHGDFVRETKELLSTLDQKRQQINDVVLDAGINLEKESANLSRALMEYDQKFKEAFSNYSSLSEQLTEIKSKLLEVKEAHKKNVSTYKTHFEQNKIIYGELGKRHNIENHLTGLFGEIERNLKNFDQEIKVLVEKADQVTIF